MIIENETLIYDILDKLKDEEPYNNIIKQFHSKILSKISLIDECIIYNPEGYVYKDIDWEYVLKMQKDFTGFEASSNEIRLGDYFDINNVDFIVLTYIIVDELATYLKRQYKDCTFEIVAQIEQNMENNILLRFYKKREQENWIDTYNLDHYKDERLLVRIV